MELTKIVTVGEHQYAIHKMDPMRQFHVSRRLAPMLAGMGITASQLKGLGSGQVDVGELMELLGPIVMTMSTMDDANMDFILWTCLGYVKRLEGERQQPIVTRGADGKSAIQYSDIDMVQMLLLTFEVCRHNLAGFMPGLSGLISSRASSATETMGPTSSSSE